MDQYIGKLLDNRYEILERIGIGGMAVVYKGRDHRLNRLVAIKILKEELAQDAEFRRRFHDESQAVAMLSHPNIMAVYDVSHSAELDYIVMELLDGITLKQYMQKKGGKLPDHEGPLPRPQPGHHPPGHQAPQHHGAAGRQPESGRLRHRPAHLRRPGHPDPGGPGLRPLYLP